MAGDGREGGFIKLYRRLESWPLWKAMSALQRMVWIQLLLSANWKDDFGWYGPRRYLVKRGQLSLSEDEIAKRAKVGRQVVRDAFVRFLAEGAVTRVPALDGTQVPWLTTVVNYERFQGSDDDENPPRNQPPTNQEPAENQPGTSLEPRDKKGRREEGKNKSAPRAQWDEAHPVAARLLAAVKAHGLTLTPPAKGEVTDSIERSAEALSIPIAARVVAEAHDAEPNPSLGWYWKALHRAASGVTRAGLQATPPVPLPAPDPAWLAAHPGAAERWAAYEHEVMSKSPVHEQAKQLEGALFMLHAEFPDQEVA